LMSAPPRGVLAVDKYFVLKSTCVTKKRLIRDKLYLEAMPPGHRSKLATILFVPGWITPADIFEEQLAYFSRTRRVVAMEPRSYGLSSQTTEGNSPEGHARDIHTVIEQLKLASVVIVGWSMGVEAVVAYIDQFSSKAVTRLVLVDELLVFDRN